MSSKYDIISHGRVFIQVCKYHFIMVVDIFLWVCYGNVGI